MDAPPRKYRLDGAQLLAEYIEKHSLSRAEFARRCSERFPIDRVTIVNLLENRGVRVSAAVAVAIEHGSEGAVPVASWLPRSDETDSANEHVPVVAPTGTEG